MREKRIVRQGLLIFAGFLVTFSEGLKTLLFGLPIVHLGNAIIFALFAEILITKFLGEFKRRDKFRISSETRLIWVWFISFLFVGSLSALIFHPSIILYFWSLRSYLRFFALFIDCVYLFDADSEDRFYKILEVVVVVHIAITLIQFVFFGIRWDYLNGIFGNLMGGNSGVNALLVINSCVCLYRFYLKKLRWQWLMFHLIWMIADAAIVELKAYFIEITVIVIAYTVLTKKFRDMAKIFAFIIPLAIIGIIVMKILYPYTSGGNFLNQIVVWLKTPHHDNHDSLSRVTQLSGMTEPILSYARSRNEKAGIISLLAGLGLGNAEFGTKDILTSEFYWINERLWYRDFLISMLYAETGIIGLIIYNSLWVFMGIKGFLDYKHRSSAVALLKTLLAVSTGLIVLYDVTLRNNYGYIMWMALAIPYIICKTGVIGSKALE
ncbi:MAG: hypothetical protein II842_11355 [Butyrivibrio sp.]|nr:hypothetical protein [Butyrivibrio sp.]